MAPNFEKDLLVVTSASGMQSAKLLTLLSKKWQHLRLIVHSASSQKRLQESYPDAEVLTADLTEPSQCLSVVSGASSIFHIGPPFHPHETLIGQNMIDASVHNFLATGKRQHFVYSSVTGAQLRKMLHHDGKRYVEEYLIECGLPYTILQPTHFMDVFPIPALVQQAKSKGPDDVLEFAANWDPSVEFSFLALDDLARVGEIVLAERERHFYAKYELCSTMPMSYARGCEIVGTVLGRTVVPRQKPFEEAVKGFMAVALKDDFGAYERDAVERMLLYYNRRGLSGNPNVLEWIIGGKATSFEDFTKARVKSLFE